MSDGEGTGKEFPTYLSTSPAANLLADPKQATSFLGLHYLDCSKRNPGWMTSNIPSCLTTRGFYSGTELWATSFTGHSSECQKIKNKFKMRKTTNLGIMLLSV